MDFEYTIDRLVRQIYKLREKHSYQVINPEKEDAQKIEELRRAIRVLSNAMPVSSLPLPQQIENLFMWHSDYSFEAGMDSCFRRDILPLIEFYPTESLKTIRDLVKESSYTNTVSEILTIIGDGATPATHSLIFDILAIGLQNPSIFIRDSAGLGFSYLGDKKAIPLLEEAIRIEPIEGMKRDLQQVIDYL